MAIRKHTSDTGLEELDIYKGDNTPKDNAKLLRDGAMRQAETCRVWLDKLEEEATAQLDATQFGDVRHSDAAMVLGLCRNVRTLIADGRIASVEAAYWPWVLGYQAKMLDIRPRERDVVRFRANMAKLNEGRNAEIGDPDRKTEVVVKAWNVVCASDNGKKLSKADIERLVFEETSIPGRTQRYHLKKAKKALGKS